MDILWLDYLIFWAKIHEVSIREEKKNVQIYEIVYNFTICW